MKLQISAEPETNGIRLVGDLDIYSVEPARDALCAYLAKLPGLKLDLTGINACDTAGLQLLIAARRGAVAAGKSFAILASAPAIEKCAELLGMDPEDIQPHIR